jgi:hypothetical protein
MLKNRFYTKFVTIHLLVFGMAVTAFSQSNRFGLGLGGGFNFSQIQGDKHQGYDKVGVSLGLTGIVKLRKNFNVGLELLYNQRGSKSGTVPQERIEFGIHPFDLKLNYAEVALLPSFFFYESYDDFYRFRLSMGVSFARLINASVDETIYVGAISEEPIVYDEILGDISKNDLNAIVGLTFFFSNQIGLELRHGVGLKPIYSFDNTTLLVYYLSLRGTYIF